MDKKKFLWLIVTFLIVYILIRITPLYKQIGYLLSVYPVEVTIISLIVGTILGFLISNNIVDGGKFKQY